MTNCWLGIGGLRASLKPLKPDAPPGARIHHLKCRRCCVPSERPACPRSGGPGGDIADREAQAHDQEAQARAVRTILRARRVAGPARAKVRRLGGRHVAAIYIATAKLNDLDSQAWLADVLARLPDYPVKRIHGLMPQNWRALERRTASVRRRLPSEVLWRMRT
ncbi:transposase domain-containing protein [Bradyrhizobium sp. NBAIM01]|uniref:transposase domain-containing protein n=1 Tax=Bradyrhizobium sp. NBAIM01 TaxID=2793818 RepID=UPI001CD4813D